jgi:hypothetical protein
MNAHNSQHLNIVLAAVMLLLISADNGFGNWGDSSGRIPENSKIDAPIEVELSFRSSPQLNRPTEVDLTVTPRQDAPSVLIKFIVPEAGFQVLSGPTEIKDSIPGDTTRVYTIALLPISMEKQKLSADVICNSADFVFGKRADIYSFLSSDTVQFSKTDIWEAPFSTEMTVEERLDAPGIKSPIPDFPIASAPGAGQIAVYGHMYYRDKNGVDQPYKNARVEIWDDDAVTDSKLATTYTDDTGYYESNPISNADPGGGGLDVYVKVYTTDDYSVSVTDLNSILYSANSSTHTDVSDGYVDMGSIVVTDANTRMSCYIYDKIANDAFNFLYNTVGWSNHYNLKVRWTPTSTNGTYYNPGGSIYLLAGDRWDPDVILHEFGHFVMYKIYGNTFPPSPNCNPHHWGSHSSLGCAWTEGWATFLQGAIQNDQYYDDTEDQTLHYDMEPPTPTAHHSLDEGAVLASLWDVFDANAESWDSINLGINGIWTIAAGNNPLNVGEFYSDWVLSTNGYDAEVASILVHHSIDVHTLTITSGPGGSPNPVASGGTANLTVSASDTLGHALSYSWTALCPALPSQGSFDNAAAQNPVWTAPANTTGNQQNCTIQVTVSDGNGLSQTGSYIQGVSSFAHTLTITSGPSGNPNPVTPGGSANLTVSATDTLGHALSYSWTALCPSLQSNGSFNNAAAQNPTWTAPANETGNQQSCTIQVTVRDGNGLSQTGSYSQGVNGGDTTTDISLSAGGVAAAGTIGSIGTAQVGYGTLGVNSGIVPYATAVFSFQKNGITVTEAGVPASPPTVLARVFIDYRVDVLALPGQSTSGAIDINTGIAIVNTGASAANVAYTLRDTTGYVLTIGNGSVAAGAHFAKFINQLTDVAPNFNLPSNFQNTTQFGTLEIASDQPLSVLALRGTNNQRNDFLITTTPVADLTQAASSSPAFFPQFADGGGYTTSLVLLNTSNRTERGTLQVFDNNGSPLVVSQVGGPADSTFRYSIPAGGAFHFQTDGSPANTTVGWVRLNPDLYNPTPIGSGVFSYNPGPMLISESGIPSAVPTTHARVYVDLSGDHNTGLAIANVESTAASITINAFQNDGVTPAGTSRGPLPLNACGHDAEFANQFITGLPAGFTGVLDISSVTPFAALTMRSLVNERDDFLMTTFPIADANEPAPSPIVFPQIVDGGGYVTRFFFISPTSASLATLRYMDEGGAPLGIGE